MELESADLAYSDGDTGCNGFYYHPAETQGPLPAVLICPAWDGLVQEVHDKAQQFARLGYVAVGVDVLGGGRTLQDFADMETEIGPFMADRSMLLQRLQAAVDAVHSLPIVDAERVAAAGYCFGGLCALDLARSGKGLRAAVSLHGGLLPNGLDDTPIDAHILVLHGHDDPMVPPDSVAAFQQEMTNRGADWQLVTYGNTLHAFTRPEANDPAMGVAYNALSDRRSWQAMSDFLGETLKA